MLSRLEGLRILRREPISRILFPLPRKAGFDDHSSGTPVAGRL
ncbi:hypothetical protein SCH4B_1828 [Ruegeria sp. TrichCH4B]|nr:hypothetical protein SCH4B_1828 [Ruegeria sp. TrichCH4B]